MRLIPLLLSISAALPALEPDKRGHAIAGAAIGTLGYAAARTVTDNRWSAFALGVVAAAGAGAAKEWAYDRARPESHTVDPRDFWWTVGGGFAGSGLAWGADVAISFDRDRAAVFLSWGF